MCEIASSSATVLSAEGISKSYGETIALQSCSISIPDSEIHGLVGENGSGKSTLVKVLSGVLRPDTGTISIDGLDRSFESPRQATSAGVATVFQETLIVDEVTVMDNILMGLDGRLRRVNQEVQKNAREVLDRLGLAHVRSDQSPRSLALSDRQLVTVARALVRPWRLLILDESTSSLDVDQRDRLFAEVRRQVGTGRSALFISHRLEEVEMFCERLSVLRLGKVVDTVDVGSMSRAEVIGAMSGGHFSAAVSGVSNRRESEVILRIEKLELRERGDGSSLEFHAGEIIGLAGLEGHGQGKFLRTIAGHHEATSGAVVVATGEDDSAVIRSPISAFRAGIAYLPADRKVDGIFPSLSVLDNMLITHFRRATRFPHLKRRGDRELATRMAKHLKIKTAGASAPITSLSGGNQQKVLLARWMVMEPRVLALHDPMRGVDPGTKDHIYSIIRGLAAGGGLVVLLSTELRELVDLCDRVLVFRDDTIEAVFPAQSLAEETLLAAMFGQCDADL